MAKVYRLAVGNSINLHFRQAIVAGGDLQCLLMYRFRAGDHTPAIPRALDRTGPLKRTRSDEA
jgi:hypothetical protein